MYIPITTMSLLALCSSVVVAERKLRGASADDSRLEQGTRTKPVLKEVQELPVDLARELGGSQYEQTITIYDGEWGSWKDWAQGGFVHAYVLLFLYCLANLLGSK